MRRTIHFRQTALRQALGLAVLCAVGMGLGACQNKSASLGADPMSTATTGGVGEKGPSFKRTEDLAKRWNADPGNFAIASAYSDSLGELGQRDTQIQVLQTVAEKNSGNAQVLSDVGKKLLALGESETATSVLERASAQNPSSWQLLSALGTAYDQQLMHVQAREKYQAALAIKPNELSVINNMGMSYALQGKLPEAERQLRQALSLPGAKEVPRIRQNLALVVGLQGRFDEAQKIASADLPPDQVQANMAYLQQMLSRPNTWKQLSDGTGGADGGAG